MRPIYLLIAGLVWSASLRGDEPKATPETPSEPEPGILLEPRFSGHRNHYPIAGARETLLVAALPTASGVRVLSPAQWEERGLTWESILPGALRTAEELAGKVEIQWIRDDRDVVLYGMIESENHLVTGILFTNAFQERVSGKLGNTFHAVVPNRTNIFVFPAFGGKMEVYAESLRAMYHESPLKVSLEILEISDSGVRAAGSITNP